VSGSRYGTEGPARQELARSFGATDILAERGDAATNAVRELTDGVGVDAALECVGTAQAMATAFAVARPGATVGYVGSRTASRCRSAPCSPTTSGCGAGWRRCGSTSPSCSTTGSDQIRVIRASVLFRGF
jgi:Zn-dependent alcohol dehydrogenase